MQSMQKGYFGIPWRQGPGLQLSNIVSYGSGLEVAYELGDMNFIQSQGRWT